jgi:hypothetical protein
MKYLVKYNDGSVGIMTTVSKDIKPYDEILKWEASHAQSVESIREIEEQEIPEDRYFREAWTHSEDKLNVDMDKCKNIHRNILRELRKPKLEALDLEYMKADEQLDDEEKALIRAKKQELRDITQHSSIVNAQTPEELKSFMPSILE